MHRRAIAILLLLLVIADQSLATLAPVQPFSGVFSETWESFPLTGPSETYLPDPSPIMGGNASIANPGMATFVAGSGYQLGSSGYPLPSDGLQYMGIGGFGKTAVVTFNDPMISFGGYWGAWSPGAGQPAVLSLTFFDDNGNLIEIEQFDYLRPFDGVLEWHGWSSTVPIKQVVFSGDYLTTDGLQANPVPEPAALAMVLLALLLARRRHRSIP